MTLATDMDASSSAPSIISTLGNGIARAAHAVYVALANAQEARARRIVAEAKRGVYFW